MTACVAEAGHLASMKLLPTLEFAHANGSHPMARTCPQCGHTCDEAHQVLPDLRFPDLAAHRHRTRRRPLHRPHAAGRLRHPRSRRHRRHGARLPRRADEPRSHRRGRRSSTRTSSARRARRRASSPRRARRAASTTRTRSASSTSARPTTASSTSSWSSCAGEDLARVAYEEGPSAFRRIVDVLRQVLAALAEAHHLGHHPPRSQAREHHPRADPHGRRLRQGRRLRPREDASRTRQPDHHEPRASSAARPSYMSPEQGRGDPLDARTDLYAVGVIFFQLLTGRLPFEADTPTQVVLMHLSSAAARSAADRARAQHPREPREGGCQVARQGARRSLGHRRRHGRGPRLHSK